MLKMIGIDISGYWKYALLSLELTHGERFQARLIEKRRVA